MTDRAGDTAHLGAHELADAQQLLELAERDPGAALPAAFAALTGLLHFWEQEPRGEHLVDLLAQAEETDSTLESLRNDALTLDGGTFATPGDAYERAQALVDAALGRVDTI